MAKTRLVIVRHYEPPPLGEAEDIRRRVYEKLFDVDLLERLTRSLPESTIALDENGKGAKYESGEIR